MSGATPQDEALQALLAAGQLEQAARRCLEIDEPLQASALFEEACLFGAASHAAERGGDLRSAVRLAAIARDDGLVVRALDRLVDVAQDDARKEAAALLSRGAHRYAAWAFDRLGDAERAAEAYKKAELPLASAHAHARAGQVALAARTLETAIREAQGAEIEAYRVALGELYGRHGKHEAAATHLQAVPKDAPQRGQALEILIPTLEALGLHDGAAALEVERETLSRLTPDVIGVVPLGEAGQSEGGGAQAGAAPVMVTLFGRYRVLREVAVSPHARLLHAVDELTGEEVAVKWLAATGSSRGRDALSHFVREARALSDLRHPAIVSLRDYVERGPAMVLEWMSGGALDALLAREVFSPSRAAEIVGSVLGALGVAHRMGIIHRDIKPANLLFDGLGAVHLADFGAAHWSASQATVTEGVIGTLAYMAPEQRRGEAACVGSDVYAVGVIFHEMLTGQRPGGSGDSAPSLAHPDLSDAHDVVLTCMLQEDPSARYASAAEAAQAVANLSWSERIVERELPAAEEEEVHEAAPPAGDDGRYGRALNAAKRACEEPYLRYDQVLARDVLLLPAADELLLRAGRIARAAHPALPCVWGTSDDGRFLVVEPAQGEPAEAISAEEWAQISDALSAVHELGGAHGAVDRENLRRFHGEIMLAFVIEHDAEASAAGDRMQLELCKSAQA